MNIAKLNTASLDDKTFIIKRGTSGGSTPDTPPSGSSWRFFDVSAMDDSMKELIFAMSMMYRGIVTGVNVIQPSALGYTYGVALSDVSSVAIDFGMRVKDAQGMYTIMEGLQKYGILDLLSPKEITEEQFYSLE